MKTPRRKRKGEGRKEREKREVRGESSDLISLFFPFYMFFSL